MFSAGPLGPRPLQALVSTSVGPDDRRAARGFLALLIARRPRRANLPRPGALSPRRVRLVVCARRRPPPVDGSAGRPGTWWNPPFILLVRLLALTLENRQGIAHGVAPSRGSTLEPKKLMLLPLLRSSHYVLISLLPLMRAGARLLSSPRDISRFRKTTNGTCVSVVEKKAPCTRSLQSIYPPNIAKFDIKVS